MKSLNKLKSKNISVLIIEIVIILICAIGVTLAAIYVSRRSNLNLTTANLGVSFTGSSTLPSVALQPIADSSAVTVVGNTVTCNSNYAICTTFTVKGASSNPNLNDIIYDVSLDNLEIDVALRNEYVKWQIYKNGTLNASGNLSIDFDSLTNNKLFLTNIQQDLPKYSSTADSYVVVIWISEACPTGVTTCDEYVDQSNLYGKTISGNIQVDLYRGTKKNRVRTPEVNAPLIENTGLIPVMYKETCPQVNKTYTEGGCWVVADSANSSNKYKWYDYGSQKWANAVLVTSTNRSSYLASNAKGTVINQADILAYYVWIPRYKYKVWNINKVAGTNSHLYPDGTTSARDNGIDIKFESGTNTTGSITCDYDFTRASDGEVLSEICTGANGDYYTHPAFFVDTNQNSVHDTGEKELTGFWMGKYETASENGTAATSDATYGGGESTSLTPRILPNITSWRDNTIPNMHTVTRNMQVSSNIYGLPTSTTTIESHLLTNQEWGAVAYLTNSKYGRCPNGSCSEVQKNSFGENTYQTSRTGCGPQTDGGRTYNNTTCNQYTTTLGKLASTTNNIYGIYDMSGGVNDYVMGNMSSSSNLNSFVLNLSSSYGTFNPTPTHINGYDYGTTNVNQTAYNRGRLGDATSEVVTTLFASSSGGWYDDSTSFTDGIYSWFLRGSYFKTYDDSAGAFSFSCNFGDGSSFMAFRVALS